MDEKSSELAKECAATLSNSWLGTLRELSARSPVPKTGYSTPELAEEMLLAFARAQSPFASLPWAIPPFGNRFERPDPGNDRKPVMPGTVAEVMESRDGFTQFAVVRALEALTGTIPPGGAGPGASWGDLLSTLTSRASGRDRPVLRAAGPGPEVDRGFGWTNYAGSEKAAVFFNRTLREELLRIDEELGTRLTPSADRSYVRNDEESIDAWGRTWTAAVAIVAADWIRWKGCRKADPSVGELAAALWRGVTDEEQKPLKLYPGNAVLPTSKSVAPGLQISLSLPIVLAQALEYSDDRWLELQTQSRQPIRIRMHVLNSEWRDGEVFYRALNGGQLYMAVLAASLDAPPPDRLLSGPETPPVGGPLPQLTPQQERCLLAIDQRRRGTGPSRGKGSGMRFSGRPDPQSLPDDLAAPTLDAGPIWDGGLDFQPPSEADESRNEIGSIDLWSSLPRSFGWFDVVFIGDSSGKDERRLLPIELDDETAAEKPDVAPASDGPARHSLVLTEPAHASALELRTAFATPGRTHWQYEYAGLGVFVVVLVELDTAQPRNG